MPATNDPRRRSGSDGRPFAVIDLGSHSARLSVLRLEGGTHPEVIQSMRVPLKLAEALDSQSQMDPTTMAAVAATLEDFQTIARTAGAARISAVATSAVRDSINSAQLVELVRERTGITLEVISGEVEAQRSFLGVINGLPVNSGLTLDVGGGSAEITTFVHRQLRSWWCLPLGAIRVTRAHLGSEPPTASELDSLRATIDASLDETDLERMPAGGEMIVTGGTARAVARYVQRSADHPIGRVHGFRVSRVELSELIHRASQLDSRELADLPGIKADRADSLVGGLCVLERTAHRLRADSILVSGQGLREGCAYELHGDGVLSAATVRRSSVLALAARFRAWDSGTAWRRARLAARLLPDALPTATTALTELLTYAALLLDAGTSIDYYDRFVHTGTIILEGDLTGFLHDEMAKMAIIARRAGDAPASYKPFASLIHDHDRPLLEGAAGVLALADEVVRRTPRGTTPQVHAERGEEYLTITSALGTGWWSSDLTRRLSRALGCPVAIT